MSNVQKGREIVSDSAVDLLNALDSLAVSGTNEGIQKTSSTTLANKDFIIGVNTSKLTVSATEPTSPSVGDIWLDIS